MKKSIFLKKLINYHHTITFNKLSIMDPIKRKNVQAFFDFLQEEVTKMKKIMQFDTHVNIKEYAKQANIMMNRSTIFCSWFIPNMKLIDEIYDLHKKTGYVVNDMGCGYGLMVCLLNYLDVKTEGYDSFSEYGANNESNDDKFENCKTQLSNLLSTYNIPWCGDDKFTIINIDEYTDSKTIFFQSWGRSSTPLYNYLDCKGKYIVLVGESQTGCTSPSADYFICRAFIDTSDKMEVKSEVCITIPQWPGINDFVTITELY